HLAKAADRLGTDLRAAPLIESGALEVRTASRAFNVMQDRIQRLVEDRTAFAAALAHDIGTPITRLVLRLEDLPESELKSKMRA
ncbi:HAMP domain-containing protein, partial [Vibrio parahaemolyticus]